MRGEGEREQVRNERSKEAALFAHSLTHSRAPMAVPIGVDEFDVPTDDVLRYKESSVQVFNGADLVLGNATLYVTIECVVVDGGLVAHSVQPCDCLGGKQHEWHQD